MLKKIVLTSLFIATPVMSNITVIDREGDGDHSQIKQKLLLKITSVKAVGCDATLKAKGREKLVLKTDVKAFTGAARKYKRQNCQLLVSYKAPQGMQFAIKNVKLKTSGFIGSNVSAVVSSTYRFQGGSSQAVQETISSTHRSKSTKLKFNKLAFSPCEGERALILTTSALIKGSGDAAIELKKAKFTLAWKPCT